MHKKISDDLAEFVSEIFRFQEAVTTFRKAAVEDCLISTEKYEKSRINFDVSKNKLKALESRAADHSTLKAAEKRIEVKYGEFQKQGQDLTTKIIVLQEKRSQLYQEHMKKYYATLQKLFAQSALIFNEMHCLQARNFRKKDFTDDFSVLLQSQQQQKEEKQKPPEFYSTKSTTNTTSNTFGSNSS